MKDQLKDMRLPKNTISRKEYEKILNWTVEEATEAHKKWYEKKSKKNDAPFLREGPLPLWFSINNIERCRIKYLEHGDHNQVMDAIFHSTMDYLPLPEWCVDAFRKLYYKVHPYKAKSWDDAFGTPYPKGTQFEASKKRNITRLEVYNCVCRIKDENPSRPTDAGLFEEVGEKFGIGKTLAEKYYYFYKNMLNTQK